MAKGIEKIAVTLAGIGALNWGIISVTGVNYVDKVVSYIPLTIASTIVYAAVGIAGIVLLYNTYK